MLREANNNETIKVTEDQLFSDVGSHSIYQARALKMLERMGALFDFIGKQLDEDIGRDEYEFTYTRIDEKARVEFSLPKASRDVQVSGWFEFLLTEHNTLYWKITGMSFEIKPPKASY